MKKKENVVKKVKIVKSEYANEELLKNFYNYLKETLSSYYFDSFC